MEGEKIETQDIVRHLQELAITGPFTQVQTCSKCGLDNKRKGMIYLNMPKQSIGKKYRITYELVV